MVGEQLCLVKVVVVGVVGLTRRWRLFWWLRCVVVELGNGERSGRSGGRVHNVVNLCNEQLGGLMEGN